MILCSFFFFFKKGGYPTYIFLHVDLDMQFINANITGVKMLTVCTAFSFSKEYFIKMKRARLSLSTQCLVSGLCIIKYYNLAITAVSYYSIFVRVIWGHLQIFALCYLIYPQLQK